MELCNGAYHEALMQELEVFRLVYRSTRVPDYPIWRIEM